MKKDIRNHILDATEQVLSGHGLANTTLDMVAFEANMSKGGVLHYYANKRELLAAVLLRFEERYLARREEIYKKLPDTPSRLARATIMATLFTREKAGGASLYRIDLLEDMGYREIVGKMKARLFGDIFKGCNRPEKALTALYMLDGMWMHHLFTPAPIPAAVASRCRKWLLRYIDELYEDYV